VGVGARNLQECLLIQIDYLKEQGVQNSLVEEMVRRCWPDLCNHKYEKIAKTLRISDKEVKSALQFIQKNLNSQPGMQFRVPWNHKPTNPAGSVKPDVIIRKRGKDYEIEVVESQEFALQISESYKNFYQEISRDRSRYSEEERKHIGNYVERAKMFIHNILHRRKTLYEISKSILEHQREFLDKENKVYLKPLTRMEVARDLGKDISTISRAIADKYIQIPTGELVSFDQFFGTSLGVKGAVRELLLNETPDKPLSDHEIANILRSRGFKVARRTIAKYRAQMRFLPSDKRH